MYETWQFYGAINTILGIFIFDPDPATPGATP